MHPEPATCNSKPARPYDRERFSIVIPVYNHEGKVQEVLKEALELNLPVIVVDDGSTDSTADRINTVEGVRVLRHQINQGKGAAILTGFKEALKISDWAITMDADGQHHPKDAIRLMGAVPEGKRPIVVGIRQGMIKTYVPWTSRFGRRFSNFWVWISGGPRMKDSQSGFRIYPLPECMNLDIKARRFQFEVEVLVKANRNRMPIIEEPIQVTYDEGDQRISHFHPFLDFCRNFGTFSRLITQRILCPRPIRKGINRSCKK